MGGDEIEIERVRAGKGGGGGGGRGRLRLGRGAAGERTRRHPAARLSPRLLARTLPTQHPPTHQPRYCILASPLRWESGPPHPISPPFTRFSPRISFFLVPISPRHGRRVRRIPPRVLAHVDLLAPLLQAAWVRRVSRVGGRGRLGGCVWGGESVREKKQLRWVRKQLSLAPRSLLSLSLSLPGASTANRSDVSLGGMTPREECIGGWREGEEKWVGALKKEARMSE
jgi:hypothetical protein